MLFVSSKDMCLLAGDELTARSLKNPSNEIGLPTNVSMKVFLTTKGDDLLAWPWLPAALVCAPPTNPAATASGLVPMLSIDVILLAGHEWI
jgi:hypothetical protein